MENPVKNLPALTSFDTYIGKNQFYEFFFNKIKLFFNVMGRWRFFTFFMHSKEKMTNFGWKQKRFQNMLIYKGIIYSWGGNMDHKLIKDVGEKFKESSGSFD